MYDDSEEDEFQSDCEDVHGLKAVIGSDRKESLGLKAVIESDGQEIWGCEAVIGCGRKKASDQSRG